MWGIEENAILGGGAAQLALLGEHTPDTCGSRGRWTPATRDSKGRWSQRREGDENRWGPRFGGG
jgi:hypothetical protein